MGEVVTALLWFLGELLWSLLAEFGVGLAGVAWDAIRDDAVHVEGGRLSPRPGLMLALYAAFGAAAAGALSFFHPAPLGAVRWLRVVGLCALPLACGVSLLGWDELRGRVSRGRGRAAFWAGLAFGLGWVAVRAGLRAMAG